jgi:hypothetical protein
MTQDARSQYQLLLSKSPGNLSRLDLAVAEKALFATRQLVDPRAAYQMSLHNASGNLLRLDLSNEITALMGKPQLVDPRAAFVGAVSKVRSAEALATSIGSPYGLIPPPNYVVFVEQLGIGVNAQLQKDALTEFGNNPATSTAGVSNFPVYQTGPDVVTVTAYESSNGAFK